MAGKSTKTRAIMFGLLPGLGCTPDPLYGKKEKEFGYVRRSFPDMLVKQNGLYLDILFEEGFIALTLVDDDEEEVVEWSLTCKCIMSWRRRWTYRPQILFR
jgi:hypothetical protein